jgi:hypothetical protein
VIEHPGKVLLWCICLPPVASHPYPVDSPPLTHAMLRRVCMIGKFAFPLPSSQQSCRGIEDQLGMRGWSEDRDTGARQISPQHMLGRGVGQLRMVEVWGKPALGRFATAGMPEGG